jgi:hypothetical protein
LLLSVFGTLCACAPNPGLVQIAAFDPVINPDTLKPTTSDDYVVTEGVLDVTPGAPSFVIDVHLAAAALTGFVSSTVNSSTNQTLDTTTDYKLVINALKLSYTISPKVVAGFKTATIPQEMVLGAGAGGNFWRPIDLISPAASDVLNGVPVSNAYTDRAALTVVVEFSGYNSRNGQAFTTGQDMFPITVLNSQGQAPDGTACKKPMKQPQVFDLSYYLGQNFGFVLPDVCCDGKANTTLGCS